MTLSKEQVARYSRQLILPELGVKGQEKLLGGSVLVIGAGGLGSPACLYLAAAGVGRIGLADPDTVSPSDLHRQILHSTAAQASLKVDSAKARLEALNPAVCVETFPEAITAHNARSLISRYDVVVDGADNFPTRYLANDACVLESKPLVHGAVVRFEGQLFTVIPGRSACLRCVFPEPPQPEAIPRCQEAGVLGPEAGVIGSLMAHEALKLLAGVGELLTDRLLVMDGWASRFREVAVRRNPDCAVCGDSPTITAAEAYAAMPGCAS